MANFGEEYKKLVAKEGGYVNDKDDEYLNALILCDNIEKWVFGYSWLSTNKLFCGNYRHSSKSTDKGLGKYTYDIFMKKLGYTDKEINL